MKSSLALVAGVASQAPTVTTLNCTLQGAKCASTDVNAYLFIPFEKAPLGHLRFAPPQPWNESFSGVRDATKPAPTCVHLLLNVWVPPGAKPDPNLPVLVWLYGGSNTGGGISNLLYDGCLASKRTIQVSVNYRVSPLGILAAELLGVNGNLGLQDQLFGLRWVHGNIASFGGDPARVVLFGQSAGATDAWVISTLPRAAGLLSAAILQSTVPSDLPDLATASKNSAAFLRALNGTTLAPPTASPRPERQLIAERRGEGGQRRLRRGVGRRGRRGGAGRQVAGVRLAGSMRVNMANGTWEVGRSTIPCATSGTRSTA
ncbi:hypothetical protein DL765_002728 [Monosporascus sp. GIB2]|nr:hypothetical protein DL765_002728 [Monosporascus sp. GIB2]